MATKISSKQCRSARDLLKWNMHDLASKVNVPSKRIESFERGSIQLYQNENSEIAEVLKKEGIEFLSDFEVKLKKEAKDKPKANAFAGSVGLGSTGEGMKIIDDGTGNSAGLSTTEYAAHADRQSMFSSPADEAGRAGVKPSGKKP